MLSEDDGACRAHSVLAFILFIIPLEKSKMKQVRATNWLSVILQCRSPASGPGHHFFDKSDDDQKHGTADAAARDIANDCSDIKCAAAGF